MNNFNPTSRRFAPLAFLLTLVASLMVAAPAEARTTCGNGHREHQGGRVTANLEWDVASIHQPCIRVRNDHAQTMVKPMTLRFTIQDHNIIRVCEIPTALDYVKFTAHYSDHRGHNYNLGPWELDCQSDGFNTRVVNTNVDTGLLVSTIAHPAKLRVNIEAVKRAYPNPEDSAFFVLRWFNFPFGRVNLADLLKGQAR